MSGIVKAKGAHSFGYTAITQLNGKNKDMMMDFGILRLGKDQNFQDDLKLEKAYLLVYGEVTFKWEGKTHTQKRTNCFDESPTVLHVPENVKVEIIGVSEDSEINVMRTNNEKNFSSKLYLPEETPDEHRGAGLMKETSTRIVRTVFDYTNAPYANLVVGEVIGFPGKWSSYPPHHHPQPEVYYYKTYPEQGFAYAELGDEVVKVQNNDTVMIGEGLTHPHCTAPGYALWYLWVIRHLDENPYITPTFLPQHLWVQEKDAVYWPDKRAD